MMGQKRISVDPAILVGKPFIKGTRLAVEFLLELMAEGWTSEQILGNYPQLTADDLKAIFRDSDMERRPVRKTIDPRDRERIVRAAEQYFAGNREGHEACDKCGGRIEFEQLSPTAWKHRCPCGKYDGTMRGL